MALSHQNDGKRNSIIHNNIWSSNVKKTTLRSIIKNVMKLKKQRPKIPKIREKIFKHFFKHNKFKSLHSEVLKLERKIITNKKVLLKKMKEKKEKKKLRDLGVNENIPCRCHFCSNFHKIINSPDSLSHTVDLKINSVSIQNMQCNNIHQQNMEILRKIRSK